MEWYNYLTSFLAGMFFANVIPHYVKGVTGESFPTPFAKPPGKGLSSPMSNIIWALVNLVIGFLFFKFSRISSDNELAVILFFIGIGMISIHSAKNFSKKEN